MSETEDSFPEYTSEVPKVLCMKIQSKPGSLNAYTWPGLQLLAWIEGYNAKTENKELKNLSLRICVQ